MTQATASKPSAGVLPIPAAITEKSSITPITTAAKSAAKASTSRLKLIIRRLPPGLTQSEFETFLGDEWMTGLGKIDWLLYRPGKVSREYAISFCSINPSLLSYIKIIFFNENNFAIS